MRNFLNRLGESFRRFMYGRYGGDALCRTTVYVGLALIILSNLLRFRILYTLALILFFWAYFRTFSKNIYKRQQELAKYYRFTGKLRDKLSMAKRIKNDRTHRYFKCPSCGTFSRVPKGRGKVKITCKKCGMQMIKKT